MANNMDLKMPVPKFPANASIMEQFQDPPTEATFQSMSWGPSPIWSGQHDPVDGTNPRRKASPVPPSVCPGASVWDSNDDVWVGNM